MEEHDGTANNETSSNNGGEATASDNTNVDVVDGELTKEQLDRLAGAERVELRLSGSVYSFKVPDFEELTVVEETLPILDTTDDAIEKAEDDPQRAVEFLAGNPDARKRFFERVNKLLCVCSITPRLTNESEVPDEDTTGRTRWVRWLRASDRASAFAVLMGLSSFTREAGIELRPFSGLQSNERWTRLQAGTESSPAKSSTAEE